VGEAIGLVLKIAERYCPGGAVLSLPQARDCGSVVPVEAVPGDVDLPVQEPAAPLGTSRTVLNSRVRLEPLDPDFFHHGVPKGFGLLAGESQKLFAIGEAEFLHEPKDVGLLDPRSRWLPDPVAGGHVSPF
jgi:hypothetical protein